MTPGAIYINLQESASRRSLERQPALFSQQLRARKDRPVRVLVDEIQRVPALLDAAIPVTLMDSVILVHESIPAEIVQKITATLIKNQGQRLATIHPSMAGWTPAKAVNYRGVPFHPGAAAAFRAAGVNPPA